MRTGQGLTVAGPDATALKQASPADVVRAGPVVETTNGRLRGVQSGDVHVFRGVRYGDDTAGQNRFLPPQPVRPWAGVRDALEWGHSAPQLPVPENTDPFYAWYAALGTVGEDCLVLNVFTPGLGDAARRPVMLWIHGGGWREFSGTAPGFDGTHLARAQDVVVVTINHRLNAFGFLNLSGSDERFADAGNAGLLDIVAALAWVRDNAAAFGGDPANVTVFGESGGASKIAALLAMRAAHGLFHKAVLQSSGGGLRLAEPEETRRLSAGLARTLGRSRLDGAALQALPMTELLTALRTTPGPFRGAIDGRNLDEHPFGAATRALCAGLPVLAGCTNTETTYHLRANRHSFSLALADVKRRLQRFLRVDDSRTERVIDAYRACYPGSTPADVLVMVTSDFTFKRTTYGMAALHAAYAHVPVYAYLFSRETPVDGGIMRAPHTTEVPFIFGTTEAAVANVGAGPDVAPITATMMATWATFARTGNPGHGMLPDWAPYSDGDRRIMVLDLVSHSERDPGGAAQAALDGLPPFGYGHSLQAFIDD